MTVTRFALRAAAAALMSLAVVLPSAAQEVSAVAQERDWAVFVGTWPRIILVAITVLLVLREIQKSLQAQKQRREEILTTASYD